MRSDSRLYFLTHSGPKDCSERMAVGAVYSSDTCAAAPAQRACHLSSLVTDTCSSSRRGHMSHQRRNRTRLV